MTPQEMEQILKPRPFQPVRVYLKDGTSHAIRDPLLKLITPHYLIIGWAPDNARDAISHRSYHVGWEYIDRVEVDPSIPLLLEPSPV